MALTGDPLALAFIVVEALSVPVVDELDVKAPEMAVYIQLRMALDVLVLRHVGDYLCICC